MLYSRIANVTAFIPVNTNFMLDPISSTIDKPFYLVISQFTLTDQGTIVVHGTIDNFF